MLSLFFSSTVAASDAEDGSRLTDTVLPLKIEREGEIPARPAPLLELGKSFLNTGKLGEGIEIPTGAVWQPSLVVWGVYRTALQSFDDSERRVSEWSNRFDLFSNLYLTPTERIFMSIRPLDKNGAFTRYTFEDTAQDEAVKNEEGDFEEELNSDIRTLFFEGDFGELFPMLDPKDSYALDYSIAVGRQPLTFQDGILIDDAVDSLGVSKINLKPSWLVNLRTAVLWGWGELNRQNLSDDDRTAQLYGVFNELEWRSTTVEIDAIYLEADPETGDGVFGGIGATQRFGRINTTFRLLGSAAVGEETEQNSDGGLVFVELSATPHASDDLAYLSGFYALDRFRSASRDPSAGGPLGATGISFASVQLGRYRTALDNQTNDSFGSALGYQLFFAEGRRNLILELAGRSTSESVGQRGAALSTSFQTAISSRWIVRLDGFLRYAAQRSTDEDRDGDFGFGSRVELVLNL